MDSEALVGKMAAHSYEINLFGIKIPMSDSIINMWIVMAIIIVLAFIFTRNLKKIPTGKQHVIEIIVEFINNLSKSNFGHHWRSFAPYFGTVMIFLLFSNIISILNVIPTAEGLHKITGLEFFEHLPEFEISPPTKDINVTATMGIMTILLLLFSTIKIKGVKGWLKTFVTPLPVMIPFKIMEYGIRPLSLCLRLFGNILAAFTIMELLYLVEPILLPGVFSIYFDLFDGILQAYVFVFLSSLYISESIE